MYKTCSSCKHEVLVDYMTCCQVCLETLSRDKSTPSEASKYIVLYAKALELCAVAHEDVTKQLSGYWIQIAMELATHQEDL